MSFIFIQENAYEKGVWKMSPSCLGLNVLMSNLEQKGCHIEWLIITGSVKTQSTVEGVKDCKNKFSKHF